MGDNGHLPGEQWDAVVVGSGFGGLVCAGYLAACGRRVLVLEQHDVAGGNAHAFRRRRAYEFDVGLHYVGDCGPGGILPAILSGLGLADRVAFRSLDPDGFDELALPGLDVRVPAGWDRYRDRLKRALPGDAEGIDAFAAICEAIGKEKHEALLADMDLDDPRMLKLMPLTGRWGRRTLHDLFEHCGLSARARAVLAAQSANYGSPPSATTVFTHVSVLDHYLRGAYYPVGGAQGLVAALVEALEARGGELRTRSRVERILVERGTARGVRLADGTEIEAPLVVSNADYPRTILELTGAEHFPPALVKRTRGATMRLPVAVLYAGLDRDFSDRPNANVWWHRGWDVEAAYREVAEGCPSGELPFAFLSFASLKDPESPHVCPPGHTNLQVMAPLALRYGGPEQGGYRRDPAYAAEKERVTELLLTAAERALGPIRDSVVHLETATALTHQRYISSTGGTPYGLATWGPFGMRPEARTSVKGLYVVGQSSRYGSGIVGVAISGILCAARVTGRRLLAEAHAGAVFTDPALLPERPADWDPMAVSRGAARRDRSVARTGRGTRGGGEPAVRAEGADRTGGAARIEGAARAASAPAGRAPRTRTDAATRPDPATRPDRAARTRTDNAPATVGDQPT
ncbi:phytoene desaturase family protein [Streptomyces mobaraensis]|uniref:NAD(P)/FAD-dependent oxidoreductase n=1 Tax=Streptomyces mobaraensis TaxID=35621 RepID=A0A5N5W118_STRMB|nr:NAD(P)/FAD-dependent oxidoreductase [Streptomyces mobaraensis]KAB7834289.1 NAD(P)/FAD-dependent oxidoreductase [Streptomyces mobaraensis]